MLPVAPSPEINDRLAKIDPRLSLRLLVLPEGPAQWVVVYRWAQDDARRQLVKEGKLSDDMTFDILTYLPADCPPDQAFGYIVNGIKYFPANRAELDKMLLRVDEYNKYNQSQRKKEILEYAEEVTRANPGLFETETGKRVTKSFPNK